MSRKWIGVVVAVMLAAVGTWILVRYVQGAENRALEGEQTVAVLVVDEPIPAGSAATDIGGKVRVELIPAKVQAPGSLGSLDDLADLGDLVAAVDLIPGEQVIAARFIATQTLEEQDDIAVPDGMLELTVSLVPERVVGGVLRPGSHVAVFSSFESSTTESVEFGSGSDQTVEGAAVVEVTGQSAESPSSTSILLHKVLVTNVQVQELPPEQTSDDTSASTLNVSPTGSLLVTLAMEPRDAERFVFSAEFGTVWLAEESDTVDEAASTVQDRSTVYENATLGGD
jgi:pilus assembly protein CpaB